ncbi:hypothetical protein ACF0H5_009978 [Mactra antiquata]
MSDEYSHTSQLLSDVLEDIGLDEDTVKKKRESCLLCEAYNDIFQQDTSTSTSALYYFGSKSEGTTTVELQSDLDQLLVYKEPMVIEDIKFWQAGRYQLLMIRNESVTPGYCFLQALRTDVPQPEQRLNAFQARIKGHQLVINTANSLKEEQGMILLQNDVFDLDMSIDHDRNGPAFTSPKTSATNEADLVLALKCDQWPRKARIPADEENPQKWPTMDMKKEAESTGCFIIAVAGKESQYGDFEWRISTAKAERILMFSLNITQLQCFVLLKIVLKTFIHPKHGKVLTSYMCKNVLFHQIKKGHQELWQKHTLFACFKDCIMALHSCVKQKCLPRFIMPEDNLMTGKVTDKVQNKVLKEIEYLLDMNVNILSTFEIEDLGLRLSVKANQSHISLPLLRPRQINNEDVKQLQTKEETSNVNDIVMKVFQGEHVARIVICTLCSTLIQKTTLHQVLHKYQRLVDNGNKKQREACLHLIPMIKSSIGCIEASTKLANRSSVSEEIFEKWFPDCINEDNIWSCLKKASLLYCSGHAVQAETFLQEVNKHIDANNVHTLCRCKGIPINIEQLLLLPGMSRNKTIFAPCINFLCKEMNSIPRELQYERYRYVTVNTTLFDDMLEILREEFWKACVTVDVSHFLYYLQFKIYQQLDKEIEKNRALENLQNAITSDSHSRHIETAYNLLGQCLEEENRMDEATECYFKSLKLMPKYNIALIHVCILLCKVIHHKT